MQAVDQLFFGELLTGEVFFHHLFGIGGNAFHQGITETVHFVHLFLGQLDFHDLAIFRFIGLAGNDIDNACGTVALFKEGEHKGSDAVAELAAQVLVHIVEVGVFLVDLGHIEEAGQLLAANHTPGFFGAHIDAVLGGDHDQAAAGHAEGLGHFSGKVEITRGIQNIQLVALGLQSDQCGLNGDLPLYLFRVVIAHRGAVGDLAQAVGVPGHIQQALHQGGFAIPAVSQQADIPDFFSCVGHD